MSTKLFDWFDSKTWLSEVSYYAEDFLSRRVQNQIKKSKPACWSDDFGWLPVVDGAEKFAASFARYYQSIRCFHGCRPESLESYYNNGLLGQAADSLESHFLEIYKDVPKHKLIEVITEFQSRKVVEHGKSWVVLNRYELVEESGHYLIQGSEYLMALAATLCRKCPGEDYRMRLRSIGIPTIIELHIPFDQLQGCDVQSLSNIVLASWGERIAQRSLGVTYNPCLEINGTVAAKYLVSHTHPKRIRDPHCGFNWYMNERTACSYCAGIASLL